MMDMKLSSDSQYQKMATYRSVRSMLDLFYALKLSRKDLRVLVGLFTGHADLNRHLALMQVCTDELCSMSRGGGDLTTLVREVLCFNQPAS